MTRDDWLTMGLEGWQPLLAELDAKLQQRWPDYTIQQVKEKFGTLRFYAEPGVRLPDFPDDQAGIQAHQQWYADNVEAFQGLIDQYEAKSAQICQLCGKPGQLGTRGYWWSTRCQDCAPEDWVAQVDDCTHPSITDGVCDDCSRGGLARLEHSDELLVNTHSAAACAGEHCTVHNRSGHRMRSFPQHWRADRGLMERICPHGVGHPDPDDSRLTGPDGAVMAVHGCDGCCVGGAR